MEIEPESAVLAIVVGPEHHGLIGVRAPDAVRARHGGRGVHDRPVPVRVLLVPFPICPIHHICMQKVDWHAAAVESERKKKKKKKKKKKVG